LQKDQPP